MILNFKCRWKQSLDGQSSAHSYELDLEMRVKPKVLL